MQWAMNINRHDLIYLDNLYKYSKLLVCSDHFDENMYNCPDRRLVDSRLMLSATPFAAQVIQRSDSEETIPMILSTDCSTQTTLLYQNKGNQTKSKPCPADLRKLIRRQQKVISKLKMRLSRNSKSKLKLHDKKDEGKQFLNEAYK